MNATQLIDDLRAQMTAWTAADEPDLAALLAPRRRRPSRTLWAAGGVTVTAGAAAAAVLIAQAGAPAHSAIQPARAGTPGPAITPVPATPLRPSATDQADKYCAGQKTGSRAVQPELGDGMRWLPPAAATSPTVTSAGLSIACPPPESSNVTLDQALWVTYGPNKTSVESAVSFQPAPVLTEAQKKQGMMVVDQWTRAPHRYPVGGGTARITGLSGENGVDVADWVDSSGAEHWVYASGLSTQQTLAFINEVASRPGGYADPAAVAGWTRVADDPVGNDDGRKWMATLADGVEIEASTGVVGSGLGTGIGSAASLQPGSVRLPDINGRSGVFLTTAQGAAQVTWTTAEGVHVLIEGPASVPLLALARSLRDAPADDQRINHPKVVATASAGRKSPSAKG